MMRPDDLSRPLSPGKPARLPGTTLELAKRYLELMRRAKKMRATTVFGPFKAWRTRRLQGQADRTRRSAAEVWGQLYVRFRPLISHALAQARARDASTRPEVTFLSRVVVALEEEIERDDANTCFADLLCKALAVAARPHAGVAQDLRCKVHLRAVMDTCPEDGAVTTIDLLAYLRGEHAHRSGQVAAEVERVRRLAAR